LDLKASAKDFDSASQGGGVGAVASQGKRDRSPEWLFLKKFPPIATPTLPILYLFLTAPIPP